MNRVVHFELPAEDPARAAAFYESVFGWKIHKWAGPIDYWMVETGTEGGGIDGGLSGRNPGFPTNAPVNVIGVESTDATVAAIVAAGGAVMAPKMAVPGIGWLAYCTDTEGVLFGVMQSDPSAA